MSHWRSYTIAGSLCALLALAGCSDDDNDPAAFTGTLSAANQVPPVTSPATGSVTLNFDGDSSVQFRVTVNAISDVTGAHIHSGTSGASGPLRVTLFTGTGTGAGTPPMSGELTQGTFGSSDVQGISFDALLEEMRNGSAYVDIHTAANPNGEIRGQIELTP